jgi:hypothetical protein
MRFREAKTKTEIILNDFISIFERKSYVHPFLTRLEQEMNIRVSFVFKSHFWLLILCAPEINHYMMLVRVVYITQKAADACDTHNLETHAALHFVEKSRVYEVHFAKENNTFLLIYWKLFWISKNKFKQCVDHVLLDKNCTYIYSNGINFVLFSFLYVL